MTEQELAAIRERVEITKTFGPPTDGNVSGFDWYALDVAKLLEALGEEQRLRWAAEQDRDHWKEQSETQRKELAMRRKDSRLVTVLQAAFPLISVQDFLDWLEGDEEREEQWHGMCINLNFLAYMLHPKEYSEHLMRSLNAVPPQVALQEDTSMAIAKAHAKSLRETAPQAPAGCEDVGSRNPCSPDCPSRPTCGGYWPGNPQKESSRA